MQRPRGSNCSAGSPACAACKYQRRKCTRNCLLAPYFPAHQQKEFLNAHKLFGVSNIIKTIKNLDPRQRLVAMNSVKFEANTRADHPVGGCYAIISGLKSQIDWVKAELDLVLHQLAICKAQAAASQRQQMVQVGEDDEANGFHCLTAYDGIPVQEQEEGSFNVVSFSVSQAYNVFDSNSIKVESEGSAVPLRGLSDVGEDIKPLLPIFDEKEAAVFPFDSKSSSQCSDKLVLKDEIGSIQHELKHDLKSAASLFTLTNGKR